MKPGLIIAIALAVLGLMAAIAGAGVYLYKSGDSAGYIRRDNELNKKQSEASQSAVNSILAGQQKLDGLLSKIDNAVPDDNCTDGVVSDTYDGLRQRHAGPSGN